MDPLPHPSEPPVPADSAMSLIGRMLNIVATPGDVFEQVKAARPAVANWLVPALLYSLVSAVSFLLIFSQPTILQHTREQQTKNLDQRVKSGKMTQADADKVLATNDKYMPMVMKMTGVISGFLTSFLEVFWWALMLWLIARFALKQQIPFLKWLEVSSLASIVSILDVIVRTLLAVSLSNPAASLSPAMLMKHPGPQNVLFMLLSVANIMTFWVLAVRSIGLMKLSGGSFGKAASWTFGVWLVLMAILIAFSMAGQAVAAQLNQGGN